MPLEAERGEQVGARHRLYAICMLYIMQYLQNEETSSQIVKREPERPCGTFFNTRRTELFDLSSLGRDDLSRPRGVYGASARAVHLNLRRGRA